MNSKFHQKMTQTFPIFNREHHDRTYCSSAFYVTESIDDVSITQHYLLYIHYPTKQTLPNQLIKYDPNRF